MSWCKSFSETSCDDGTECTFQDRDSKRGKTTLRTRYTNPYPNMRFFYFADIPVVRRTLAPVARTPLVVVCTNTERIASVDTPPFLIFTFFQNRSNFNNYFDFFRIRIKNLSAKKNLRDLFFVIFCILMNLYIFYIYMNCNSINSI